MVKIQDVLNSGVYECVKCGYCDYGTNKELRQLLMECDIKEKFENSLFEELMMK